MHRREHMGFIPITDTFMILTHTILKTRTFQQFTLPLVFLVDPHGPLGLLVDPRGFRVTCNETRNLPHESKLLCAESESVHTESASIRTEYGQSVCHYL